MIFKISSYTFYSASNKSKLREMALIENLQSQSNLSNEFLIVGLLFKFNNQSIKNSK